MAQSNQNPDRRSIDFLRLFQILIALVGAYGTLNRVFVGVAPGQIIFGILILIGATIVIAIIDHSYRNIESYRLNLKNVFVSLIIGFIILFLGTAIYPKLSCPIHNSIYVNLLGFAQSPDCKPPCSSYFLQEGSGGTLIAHFLFNGDASSIVNNNVDATAMQNLTYPSSPCGNAISFTQDGQRIEIPDEIAGFYGNKSIVMVAKIDSVPAAAEKSCLLDKSNKGGYQLHVSGHYLTLEANDKNAQRAYSSRQVPIEMGKWSLIAITYRQDTFRLYVDDHPPADLVPDGGYRENNLDLIVGAGGTPYVNNHNIFAEIDEMIIYSEVLSDDEIGEMYRSMRQVIE